jgi:membrane fusion protein, multidrug efflux system
MRKNLVFWVFIGLWIFITAGLSWGAFQYRDDLRSGAASLYHTTSGGVELAKNGVNDFKNTFATTLNTATTYWGDTFAQTKNDMRQSISTTGARIELFFDRTLSWAEKTFNQMTFGIESFISNLKTGLNSLVISLINTMTSAFNAVMYYPAMTIQTFVDGVESTQNLLQKTFAAIPKAHKDSKEGSPVQLVAYGAQQPPPEVTEEKKQLKLSDLFPKKDDSQNLNDLEPAAGVEEPSWPLSEPSITVETVLVPRQVTVISSSQDGKISDILVHNGDYFKKGDVLIAYDCADLEAEAEIARIEKEITQKKANDSSELFKLNIISDLDRFSLQAQDRQADAKGKFYEARMRDCTIRALFDGRVTKRLANEGEYTRTDRVLLEVASSETLQAEFLIPSKWLRWVNIGAPITLFVSETEREYTAKIIRIFGEVDPVSQSIQMVAELDPYEDKLLPGMSGQATIDIEKIRAAGINGYLEARGP